MQIVTDSVSDDASKVNHVLDNVILPIYASRLSSLSTMSGVNIANEFQIESSCKSLIIWSLRAVQVEFELMFDAYITYRLWWQCWFHLW